jgi:aspartate/methionine/tyrosine aminotransferase
MFAAKHMVNGIRNILQVDCFEPKGGLFTCINVKKNSASFVEETLTKTGVLLVPGWGFGNTMQTAVRLSYGPLVNDCNQIDRGIHAMATQFSNRVT